MDKSKLFRPDLALSWNLFRRQILRSPGGTELGQATTTLATNSSAIPIRVPLEVCLTQAGILRATVSFAGAELAVPQAVNNFLAVDDVEFDASTGTAALAVNPVCGPTAIPSGSPYMFEAVVSNTGQVSLDDVVVQAIIIDGNGNGAVLVFFLPTLAPGQVVTVPQTTGPVACGPITVSIQAQATGPCGDQVISQAVPETDQFARFQGVKAAGLINPIS